MRANVHTPLVSLDSRALIYFPKSRGRIGLAFPSERIQKTPFFVTLKKLGDWQSGEARRRPNEPVTPAVFFDTLFSFVISVYSFARTPRATTAGGKAGKTKKTRVARKRKGKHGRRERKKANPTTVAKKHNATYISGVPRETRHDKKHAPTPPPQREKSRFISYHAKTREETQNNAGLLLLPARLWMLPLIAKFSSTP